MISKNRPNLRSQPENLEKAAGQDTKKAITQKPLILAAETSGRTGSAAIGLGEQILAETTFSGSTITGVKR